jgi:hypothetical protein
MGVPIGLGPTGPIWHPQNNVISNPVPPPPPPVQTPAQALAEHVALQYAQNPNLGVSNFGPQMASGDSTLSLASMGNTIGGNNPFIEQVIRYARKRRLDPAAILADAAGEGGWYNREGDIGDLAGGGSYGPFQLYAQGALPQQFRGKPEKADAWAWSKPGIRYGLNAINNVASGLTGKPALDAIVTQFERPANAAEQVEKRWGYYPEAKRAVKTGGGSIPQQMAGLMELIYQNNPAVLGGQWVSSPGAELAAAHQTHVHEGAVNPYILLQSENKWGRRGFQFGENPLTTGVNPVHAGQSAEYGDTEGSGDPSYHYRHFVGQDNKLQYFRDPITGQRRPMNQAFDITDTDPSNKWDLGDIYKWVANRYVAGVPEGSDMRGQNIYAPVGTGGVYKGQAVGVGGGGVPTGASEVATGTQADRYQALGDESAGFAQVSPLRRRKRGSSSQVDSLIQALLQMQQGQNLMA